MSAMREDVLALPDQLRDALWRIETARLEPAESAGLMVCGMGGSAIGGDLAAAALGDRLTKPLISIRGYELPSWTTPEWTVLCSSYSGRTEETLACFEAAEILGTRRIVLSTGGPLVDRARAAGVPVVAPPGIYQPRVAVAYMFVAAAEAAALAGAAPSIHTEIDAAAAFLEREREALRARAKEIAEELEGVAPLVVYGADLTAPVAHRWKTQLNENAKLPSFYAELPEADHNEVCAWSGDAAAPSAAVFLEDCDQHPRERRRFELTAGIVAEAAAVVRAETVGETRVERLLWGTLLGDLVSLEIAEKLGVDPERTDALDRIKEGMAE
jgi:glucose/mannose-6-phosphate isomerase